MYGKYSCVISAVPIISSEQEKSSMTMAGKSPDNEATNTTAERENYQVRLTFSTRPDCTGVKELLDAAKPLPETKKGRAELQRNVNADYYGYRDEEDGVLLQYEEGQEEIAMGRTMKDESGEPPEDWTPIGDVSGIPRQAEVADWLLERRKRRLMERYGG